MTTHYKMYCDTIQTFLNEGRNYDWTFRWSEQVTVVEYSRNGRIHSVNTGYASDRGRTSHQPSLRIGNGLYGNTDRFMDVYIKLYTSSDSWFRRGHPNFSSYRSIGGGAGTVLVVDLEEASWEELKPGNDPLGGLRVLRGVRRGEQGFEVEIFLHGRPLVM